VALVERGEDLFTLDADQRFLGMPIGTRMTVVRLPGDELLLYSPVRLDAGARQALAKLGRVRHIVAPNLYHHLYAEECGAAFPGARLLASPGLAAKRPRVPWAGPVPERAARPWGDVLEPLYIEGNPLHREVVLFHRPSRALIAADLVGNLRELRGPIMRLLAPAFGWGRLGPPRILRRCIRDRAAAAQSLRELLAWDIGCVIPCHGDVAATTSAADLAQAFAWLLEPEAARPRV